MRSFSDEKFAGVLRRLAQVVCRYRGWFVYPQIILSVLCLFYAVRWLVLDMDRDHLLNPNLPYQRRFLAFQKEFPGEGSELVVAVQSTSPDLNRQFTERLASRIRPETNLFTDLFYKTDPATLGPKALLLAPEADLKKMRQALHDYRPMIKEFSQATNLDSLFDLVNQKFLAGAPAGNQNSSSLVEAVPFLQNVVVEATDALQRPGHPPGPEMAALLRGQPAQDKERIYITIEDGKTFLLTVRPRSTELRPEAIERIRQLMRTTQAEVPGVNVGLTGGPVLAYDEMLQAKNDTTLASIVAFILCSVIFIVAYRQVGRPLKAALCLLIGLGYSMGFTTLAIGHLNILTITFAPMLIGLAIDFGVHFISRYEEEMRNRRTETEAVERATTFTGMGIVTGAFTTAAAFLAMALTNFKGIREMGIISGGGLLLCLVPMMTALPVLLMRGRQNARDRQLGPGAQKRLRMEVHWLRHPVAVVVVAVIICALAALQFHNVHFDHNLLRMQSQALPSVNYEKKLIHSAGFSSLYGAVVADSLEQAREFQSKIKSLPAVAEVRSAADFFTDDQQQRLTAVRSIKDEVADIRFPPLDRREVQIDQLGATLWYLTGFLGLGAEHAQARSPERARQLRDLRAAIVKFRFVINSGQPDIPEKLTAFQTALLDNFRRTIQTIQTQDTSGPLRAQDLPPVLRDRFIGVTGKYMLQVYPRNDLWQHENQRELIDQLQSVVPLETITGTPVGMYHYTTLLKKSYQEAAVYAFIAIVVMVFLHFRSLTSVVLSLIPVGVGTIWLLGLMGLAGIPFNPANVMTLPLILGIGVTNGVQVLNRFAEEHQPSIFAKSTGKAVLVSGLTAIVGFGSLTLAAHEGIRSLGIVMGTGIAACMIAALTVLPALLRILMRQDQVEQTLTVTHRRSFREVLATFAREHSGALRRLRPAQRRHFHG